MQPFLYYLTFLATGAVGVVLVLGILNLARAPTITPNKEGGKGGVTNLSQQLMRWRIILQFIAIIVIMLALWIAR